MAISNFNGYLTGLIHKKALKKQFLFRKVELISLGIEDPLGENHFKKAKGLIHRYPDRVVLTVTNKCFAYCRFCFRKNNWIKFEGFDLEKAIEYLEKNSQVKEVIISGGDPFFLGDLELENILENLKRINHIKFIRLGTRTLTVFPERIREKTIEMLKKYLPIWMVIHINHPQEITKEFKKTASMLIDTGIPLLSQTVLLKGINDNHIVLKELLCKLVENRIKPYYLFGCDLALGNEKFRVSIAKTMAIIRKLRGHVSGICMPTFAFDLPKGGGKVVLEPNSLLRKDMNIYTFRNFEGREFTYNDV